MDMTTIITSVVSAVFGAIIGGLVTHLFASRRELYSARRDQRVEFLILAHQRLSDASNRATLTQEQCDGLESAISDIILLGEKAEVGAAEYFMRQMGSGQGSADIEPVLNALRDSLRKELKLSNVPLPSPFSLRMMS